MKTPIVNRVGKNSKTVYAEAHEIYVCETLIAGKVIIQQNDHSQCKKSYCCYGYKANVPQPLQTTLSVSCTDQAVIHLFTKCIVVATLAFR